MSNVGLDIGPPGHRSHRRQRPRRRGAGCLAVLVSLAVIVAIGGFVVIQGRAWLQEVFAPPADYKGDGSGSVLVEVHDGDTSTEIASTLYDAEVVASEEAFINAAREEPRSKLIQVGFYDMAEKMSADSALDRLLDSDSIVTSTVTVPEGFTVEETLRRVGEETDLKLRDLERAAARPERLGLPEYAGGDPEGYLFPATYQLPPKTSATDMLQMMTKRFGESAARLDLEKKARSLGLSAHDVVTVASIVQSEARRPADFAKVSRVVYNRLDQGMPLQMDSTVHYAVGKSGEVATTDQDRRSDSPYNTYRFKGLPPGPIASPGDEALQAAVNPADGDWIYFVTVNIDTGETKFTASDAEHQRNVAELRRFCEQSPKC